VSGAAKSDLPVLASAARSLEGSGSGEVSADRRLADVPPAVQAAAVAAGGFVAGATVIALAHRRRERELARSRKGRRRSLVRRGRGRQDGARGVSVLEIVGSRSLLVDVHLLGSRN
jgi:hypothetical protein